MSENRGLSNTEILCFVLGWQGAWGMQMKVKASRIENGVEICNTCVRPADSPYRYKDSKGQERGCVSECHDIHVRHNTKPNWMAPRYVLPKWITEYRAALKQMKAAVK